jgi:hypothetical protein
VEGLAVKPLNRTLHESGPGLITDPGKTKVRLPKMIQEALDADGFTMKFECNGDAESVSAVAYDPERKLMLVTWVKSRTGARRGVPPGNRTIYDLVPQHVFEYLNRVNMLQGRVGQEVWNIIKNKQAPSYSNYPYSNTGGEG